LKRLSNKLGLEDAVTFTGFRSDIPALMHAFDVFVLPSRWEGFGMVFLEAMAAETPVVGSNTSAIPEVVADGETGILCEPGNVNAFADAITDLLADDGRRETMSAQCHERMEIEFSESRIINEVLSLYGELT
jgi:glycosyltransferase involved in cell wall biosynthesis